MTMPTKEELDELDRLGRSAPTVEGRRLVNKRLPGLVAAARQALELREAMQTALDSGNYLDPNDIRSLLGR